VDDIQYHSVSQNQLPASTWANMTTHAGFFIILNVAMGGGFPAAFGGGPTGATTPGVPMVVDYVAVYQAGGGGGPGPTTTTAPPPTTTNPPPGGGFNAFSRIEAERFNAQGGVQTEATTDSGGGLNLSHLANGDWAQFNNVNFGTGAPARQFVGRVASGAGGGVSGLVEVRLDSRSNPPIGSFAIANTGGWQSWRTVPANITGVTGTHTVFITFTSGQPADFVNLNWFTFGT
jgi:Carbohydrate binding module (family 6)